MSTSRRTLFASLLVPVLALAACGGDDETSEDGGGAAGGTREEATTTTAARIGGTGTGTFTIGGTEFTFEAEPCAIDGDDDDQPSVEAAGKGEAGGQPFTVVVKRSPSQDSVIENFQLVFSAAEAMVGTNFVALPDGADDTRIEVEGREAKGTFPNVLGTGGRPSGEGSFTLSCEA
jgi:type 1 fimbria pilin